MTGLMDFSLMKDPVFLFLGVSNIISMLGFYVPYVYIIDAAMERVSIFYFKKFFSVNKDFFLKWDRTLNLMRHRFCCR